MELGNKIRKSGLRCVIVSAVDCVATIRRSLRTLRPLDFLNLEVIYQDSFSTKYHCVDGRLSIKFTTSSSIFASPSKFSS